MPALYTPTFTCKTSGSNVTCTTTSTYFSTDAATWSTDDGSSATHGSRKGGHLIFTHNYGAVAGTYHWISVTVSRKGTSSKTASGSVW